MYCTLNNMNTNRNRMIPPLMSYAPPTPQPLISYAPPTPQPLISYAPPPAVEKFNMPAPKGLDWRTIEPQRQPSQFGPHYWYMLHSMALNYPVNPTFFAKKKMKAFIEAIPFLLPCRNCTEHAKEFMAKTNINEALTGRKELFTFFWNFHNLVNKRLGTPEMTFDDALNMYRGN